MPGSRSAFASSGDPARGQSPAEPARADAGVLARAAHDALRLEVGRFRSGTARRSVPPVMHVGRPGGCRADFVDLAEHRLDHALRTEVVAALLARARPAADRPVAWLARTGPLRTEDADLAWHAAARSAYGEAGVPLAIVIVTRDGWYDPRTGMRRKWKRLRMR